MCNFTPSAANTRPDISPELARAFDALRIAAARHMGWDPDETDMAICRPHPSEIDGSHDSTDSTNSRNEEEFFYAQHSF